MKTVVILNDEPVLLPVSESYAPRYAKIAAALASRGFSVARAASWDWEGGAFRRALKWSGAGWEEVSGLVPDAVWYKDSKVNARTWRVAEALGARFVNPLPFVLMARDKFAVAREFPDVSPATVTLWEAEKIPASLAALVGDKLVLKPRAEFGGRGVEIVGRARVPDLAKELGPRSRDFVLQEMVDCSGGVPGVAEGRHDLRAFFVGGALTHWCVRTAPAGDFRCNVAAGGGTYDFLPGERPVPAALEALARRVADSAGPRDGIWSADMMLDRSGGAVLGEITDSPGVDANSPDPAHQAKIESVLYGAIADLFARLTR